MLSNINLFKQTKTKPVGPLTSTRNLGEVGLAEGARGETECLHYRSSPACRWELGPEGPTMVLPGRLAATLLPPSLALLVFQLSSSQDVTSDPGHEQQLCALREHPTVAFAGERRFAPSSFCNDLSEGLSPT